MVGRATYSEFPFLANNLIRNSFQGTLQISQKLHVNQQSQYFRNIRYIYILCPFDVRLVLFVYGKPCPPPPRMLNCGQQINTVPDFCTEAIRWWYYSVSVYKLFTCKVVTRSCRYQ